MAGAGRFASRLLAVMNVGLLLASLWWADQVLTAGGTAGAEHNAVRGALKRMRASNAQEVLLLGSSTSRDWLPPSSLARAFEVAEDQVLDAHINGCHQDCTWAQVRRLLADGRHFRVAFYGTNLFQLCEYPHTKRALQQRELLPRHDRPQLFALYAHSQHPLAHVGRFLGGALIAVYADTLATQDEAARRLLGRWEPDRSWVRPTVPAVPSLPRCGYADEQVAYKRAVSEALLDDLGQLADTSFLILLPDVSANSREAADVEAWERHRALHRELAETRPHVILIDLAVPRPASAYTDGMHLQSEAGAEQRTLLMRRLDEGGYLP